MKKLALLAITALCLTGFAQAQQVPTDLYQWLITYFNYDKAAATKVLSDVQTKVQAEFPMDQKLQDALKAVDVQLQAAQLDLAKKNGFSTVDAYYAWAKNQYTTNRTYYDEIINLSTQYGTVKSNLTADYTAELNKRITAATKEAIDRLQENAKHMK